MSSRTLTAREIRARLAKCRKTLKGSKGFYVSMVRDDNEVKVRAKKAYGCGQVFGHLNPDVKGATDYYISHKASGLCLVRGIPTHEEMKKVCQSMRHFDVALMARSAAARAVLQDWAMSELLMLCPTAYVPGLTQPGGERSPRPQRRRK